MKLTHVVNFYPLYCVTLIAAYFPSITILLLPLFVYSISMFFFSDCIQYITSPCMVTDIHKKLKSTIMFWDNNKIL